MKRSISASLLGACLACHMWAQPPAGQNATQPAQGAPSAGKPTDSRQPAEINPAQEPNAPQVRGVETSEFPLDKFQNFSAIQNGGPVPALDSDVHIYRSGDLMRVEGSLKIPSYNVTDLKKRKNADVNSRTCLNMSVAYVRTFPFFVPEEGATYEVAQAGEAPVDGHQCKIEDIKVHRPKHSEVPEFRIYEAEDLEGFPIKIENHRPRAYHWVITYKDVRLGPQDRSLFIIPEKCASDADFKKLGSGVKPGTTPKKAPGNVPASKTPN